MKFNRAADISLWTCLRQFLRCLRFGHSWSDWWWVYYLQKERRVCERCGLEEERWWKHYGGRNGLKLTPEQSKRIGDRIKQLFHDELEGRNDDYQAFAIVYSKENNHIFTQGFGCKGCAEDALQTYLREARRRGELIHIRDSSGKVH